MTEAAEPLKQRKRRAELAIVLREIPPASTVLELGGESGFQAKLLSEHGHQVHSIDIDPPSLETFHPVQPYDGKSIPFASGTFDVVFSSHVLEHVQNLELTMKEIRRVLKPQGVAIHVVPSAVWRFWTSLMHYPYMMQRGLGLRPPLHGPRHQQSIAQTVQSRGIRDLARRVLLSGPHGEFPTELHELYQYSRRPWTRRFEGLGFVVSKAQGGKLFYSGYEMLRSLSIDDRKRLAFWLGSSSHVFSTRPLH